MREQLKNRDLRNYMGRECLNKFAKVEADGLTVFPKIHMLKCDGNRKWSFGEIIR